jgi:hypothetical protein
MRMRIVNWGNGPLKVALMKGERICTSCTSVTDSENFKLRGPGCSKCDPDQGVDEIMPRDRADEDELRADVKAEVFFHDCVDMIEYEDMDPVEDWDVLEDSEIMLELIMSDEEHDPVDSIHLFDVHHPLEPEEKTFRREFGLEMVMVDETNDPADPLADDDVYRSEAPIKTLLRHTGRGADAVLFSDAA